MSVFILEA